MRRFKKGIAILLSMSMVLSFAGCSKSEDKKTDTANTNTSATPTQGAAKTEATPTASAATGTEESLDYTYGAGVTFHSNEPINYSCMFSDNEAYPISDNWRIFDAITEKTNVSLDLAVYARAEYENNKSLLINTGDAPYIIPKTYTEATFIASGQIVPISDWVQYMPNYMKCVEDWGMQEDLKVKYQADGKYYVLPGLWESAGGGYSYIIRKDVFEAAGVDVEGEQGNWTYEKFYDAMKKVKEYTGTQYVFSDRFKGESTLNIAAVEYGVTAGWGVSNGMKFDWDKKEFFFADSTDKFKNYVTYFNKLISEGIMDPESFTQEDDAALTKFYKGDTFVINGSYQNLADMRPLMQVEGELYIITQPGGPEGMLQIENSRLENGVMITQRALDELGEEGFIKMLRFVDWLWYSDEGQTLSLWGLEGETYTKDASGNIVLNSDIYYNGINPDATKKLNVDYGFAGGVFAYGGSDELKLSKFTEECKDYYNRIFDTRETRKIDPPIMGTADESEEMNLISTPMIDYVKTMTLKFITGQESIEKGWDSYVAQCEANGSSRYTEMANEIFNNTKGILGY